MIKRVLITVGIASLLTACDGSNNSASVTNTSVTSPPSITGAGMKGPFAIGSTVKVCQLDTSTGNCTSTHVSTTTIDKQGTFKANVSWTGWSMIEITGKSFNEDNNTATTSDLTLKAISNITGNGDIPVVNLFTHWIAARITTLLSSSSLATAYDTAHSELKAAINLASAKTESLNLLIGSGSNVSDNALLLLFSGAFHKIGGDSNVLTQLTEDFADNGRFDKYRHLNQMRYAASETGYLTKLRNNLITNDKTLSPPNTNALTTTTVIKGTSDPLEKDQWHLAKINAATSDYTCSLSENTCRGEGVLVGVVDNGVEVDHEDLKDNIAYQKSKNYSSTRATAPYDPTPATADAAHGTAVAGLIASVDNNGKGGRGVAPRAEIAGFNVDLNKASETSDALGNADVMVSNNSWGSTENTCRYLPSEELEDTAIESAVTKGRGGKGTIILFASGNGGAYCENSPDNIISPDAMQSITGGDYASLEKRNNNSSVLSIGALNNDNTKANYAEPGSTTLVSAPAGNDCDATTPALLTTDRSGSKGDNKTSSANELNNLNYTRCMNGTSGATPIVSGVVALMLQANSDLTWRDVRMILAKSAQQNDTLDSEWKTNTAGNNVHPYYGYGMVDAKAAVAMAKSWVNLPEQKEQEYEINQPLNISAVSEASRQNTPVSATLFDVTSTAKPFSHIEIIGVEIEFAGHQRIGDLQIDLVTTSADASKIYVETLVGLNGDETDSSNNSVDFLFASLHHLGSETPSKIELEVYDKLTNGKVGLLGVSNLILQGYDHSVVASRSE